jgi:peroxiredoxin
MQSLGYGTFALACLAGVSCALTLQDAVRPGKAAPQFTAEGTDGKRHSLKSLAAGGTVLLYFIKEGCPVNHQAAPFLAKIGKAYGSKGNLIGVYNGSTKDAKAWAKRYGATFTILADPELKIIRSYQVPYSPFLVEVGKDGKIGKVSGDGNAKNLAAINRIAAASAGMKPASISFAGAPSGGG